MDKPIGIGSRVWRLNQNLRVYDKTSRGGLIFRGYFTRYKVVGETRVSWILDDDTRLSKRNNVPYETGLYTTAEQVNDACWVDANSTYLREAVRACKDATKLRAVREILGVEEQAEVIPAEYYIEEGDPCLKIKALR